MKLVFFVLFVFNLAIQTEDVITTDFDYEVADDFAQLVWDCYDQYPPDEPGAKNGRDLNWIVKTQIWVGNLLEGYIYTHETAKGSDGKDICVVAIQGTDNLADVVADIKVDVVEIVDKASQEHFWVHRGALGRLKDILTEEDTEEEKKIMNVVNNECSLDVLYVIGHSLGGAIVQLLTLGLLDGFSSVPSDRRNWDIDVNPVLHNVQAYTYSGFKPFSLPFDITHFPITQSIYTGVAWYQDNTPCPESLAGPHLHRIFTSTRDSTGRFVVDYIVVNHLFALFRFCSQGYELDLNTGKLTKDDLYAPDFFNSEINYDIGYHSSSNHINALHMPLGVYVQDQCSDEVEYVQEKYHLPSETHRVRCCDSHGACTSRKYGVCSGKKTFQEAVDFCTDMSMHVCTPEEISNCCSGNSCWYNNDQVWLDHKLEKTRETASDVYPTYPVDDPLCRGRGCDATKYGILYFDDSDHPHPEDAPHMPGSELDFDNNLAENEVGKYHTDVLERMVGAHQKVMDEYFEKENQKKKFFDGENWLLYIISGGVFTTLLGIYSYHKKQNALSFGSAYLEFEDEL